MRGRTRSTTLAIVAALALGTGCRSAGGKPYAANEDEPDRAELQRQAGLANMIGILLGNVVNGQVDPEARFASIGWPPGQ